MSESEQQRANMTSRVKGWIEDINNLKAGKLQCGTIEDLLNEL